jgi:hypothetical protein
VIAVAHIKALYDVEKDAAKRELRGDTLVAWRNEHSVPVLDAFRTLLSAQVGALLPKSPIATAASAACAGSRSGARTGCSSAATAAAIARLDTRA